MKSGVEGYSEVAFLYRLRVARRLRRRGSDGGGGRFARGFGHVAREAVPRIGQRVDHAFAEQTSAKIDLPARGARWNRGRRGGDVLPVARVSRVGDHLHLAV